jgi:hypothetical protein
MSETRPRKPFVVILAVVVVLAGAFLALYWVRVGDAVRGNSPAAAGAAHLAGQDTPAQAYAGVTTDAKPLAPSEEAVPVTNPGQPASPAR